MSVYESIRTTALSQLEQAYPELREKYGVVTVGLFGSVSRGDDTQDSDINILYTFAEDRGNLADFIGLQGYLEHLFHRRVMLVSLEFLEEEMVPSIRQDACLFGDRTEFL